MTVPGAHVGPAGAQAHPPRPATRPWHATTGLEAFAITTWATAPERLDRLLPEGFEAERFVVGGDTVALVSSVSFLDDAFRFRGAPWIRMSCGQVNHRCYVRRRGEPGVWFVGTTLDHPLVAVARRLWSMPWHHEEMRAAATWDGEACRRMLVTVEGAWGGFELAARGAGPERPDAPEVLRDPLVADPLVGWYPRRDGGTGRYSVWHEPLAGRLETVVVDEARAAPFERLGLIDAGQPPVGCLVARRTDFDVHTPPTRG